MINELSSEQLTQDFDPGMLDFETTETLQPLVGIIGQPRAVAALEFGLGIQERGFNIYVAGLPGTGKMTAVQSFLLKLAVSKPTPPDWCYLNNFDDPYQPQVIALPPGRGRQLQQDMRNLIDHARREIPKSFESDDYTAKLEDVKRRLDQERENVMLQLNERASHAGLTIEATPVGIAVVPVRHGRPLKETEFEALPVRDREEIQRSRDAISQELQNAMKQLRTHERAALEQLQQLDRQVALYVVGGLIEDLREKYQDQPAVIAFLEAVQKDILDNIDTFKGTVAAAATPEPDDDPQPNPWRQELPFRKYNVNVVVDNSKQQGAPVVIELNPSYTNLFGRIEKETHYGALYTDLTMLKGGSLHRANGGYLVLPVEDLLRNLYSWDALKGALRSGEIQIEELGERLGYGTTKTLRAGPIPLDVKILLVGSPLLYYLLHENDEQFPELFKVKAEFDSQMPRSDENLHDFLALIHTLCEREQLKHLDRAAVVRLLEQASRLAEDRDKLSTHFGAIANVVREAHFWAQKDGAANISAPHIRRALEQSIYRSNLIQERIQEMVARGQLLIDTQGAKIGQVNGLSVIGMGDYEFGRPSRITASVGPGREGIIDIEREVALGGPLHSKGVLILSGYLRYRFAADYPLTLAARLVFEQSYEGVEGDSASSAELYALLSALARLPVKQSIAVTGSVNQNGQVQAIGGVNEKIEGFFDICRAKGLTGDQGVIIPESNVQNLMLREDVVAAVKKGEFHLWGVKTIDEGIEILTGVPAGELDRGFPEETVNYSVDKRLQEFARCWQEYVSLK